MKNTFTALFFILFLLSPAISFSQCAATPELGVPSSLGLCPGVTREAVIVNYMSGTPQWYKNNAPLAGEVYPTYVITSPGTYYATVNHGNGCIVQSETVTVFNTNTGSINVGADTSLCTEGRFERFASFSGSNSMRWYLNGTFYQESSIGYVYINNIQPHQFQNGRIKLVAETVGGCATAGKDSFYIYQAPKNSLQITLGPDKIVCKGQSVTLTPEVLSPAGPFFVGFWKPGNATGTSFTYTVPTNKPSTVSVVYVDLYRGCQGHDTITLSPVDPAINVNAGEDKTYCLNQAPVELTGTASSTGSMISNVAWIHGRTRDTLSKNQYDLSYTPTVHDIYFYDHAILQFFAEDSRGCNYSDTVLIHTSETECPVTSTKNIAEIISNVNIYPIPASSYLTIDTPNKFETYQISDLSGKIIQEGKYDNRIDLLNVKKGMYLINLKFPEGSVSQKISVE